MSQNDCNLVYTNFTLSSISRSYSKNMCHTRYQILLFLQRSHELLTDQDPKSSIRLVPGTVMNFRLGKQNEDAMTESLNISRPSLSDH